MLKLSHEGHERLGGVVTEWWDGEGAARVLARHDRVLLLERAMGSASLADMARTGRDDEACRLSCAVAARLDAPRAKQLAELIPLTSWFAELETAATTHGGILARSADAARSLLAEPRECCVLHGDLHHGNVLDFETRGWLAVDPQGLLGERGFDFANIFTNPDLADPTRPGPSRPSAAASRGAWTSLRRPPGWSGSACCAGFWPGPDCRPLGSWAMTIPWRPLIFGSRR